jgi:hypothetical protein
MNYNAYFVVADPTVMQYNTRPAYKAVDALRPERS